MLTDLSNLQYPIGKNKPADFSESLKKEWLADIQFLPNAIEAAVQNLDEAQLQTPYREGGWTINQVVHHLADSHINAYMRCKLVFTEDNPTIKPYDEKRWAETTDVQNLPINISITLLYALHQRWHEFLKSLPDEAWMKTGFHPDHKKQFTLWYLLGTYSWHGRHHTAHVTNLRERMGWI